MAVHYNTRPTRRALLAGAAATLPAIPVVAFPAVILPRPGLAALMQRHVETVLPTIHPFVSARGASDWSFSISDRAHGPGGELTIIYDSERLDQHGWPVVKGLETFRIRDGELHHSTFIRGKDAVHAHDVDFPL